jgi:hypothetical protein
MRAKAAKALGKPRERDLGAIIGGDLDALSGDELAISTLQDVCRGAANPASARAQAARTLLELSGRLKDTHSDKAKPASELSAQELDQLIASEKDTASGA